MPKRPRSPRSAGARADAAAPAASATAGPSAVAAAAATATAAAPTSPAAGAVVPPLAPGAVAVHEGLALIEVADPADLAALLADRRLSELVLARIGERAAVALPQVAPRLLLAMAKAGTIATVEGEP